MVLSSISDETKHDRHKDIDRELTDWHSMNLRGAGGDKYCWMELTIKGILRRTACYRSSLMLDYSWLKGTKYLEATNGNILEPWPVTTPEVVIRVSGVCWLEGWNMADGHSSKFTLRNLARIQPA